MERFWWLTLRTAHFLRLRRLALFAREKWGVAMAGDIARASEQEAIK